MWRGAVRYLHPRHDHGHRSLAGPQPQANPGTDSRRAGRKSMPLYRLHPHLRCCCRGGGYPEMRSHPSEYELVAPGKLSAVLDLLAKEPGEWLPIAGGTEVMVQYGAGRLAARKLVSLWGLPELRGIETGQQE